ncbi:MAG: GntR family transcriptional regulator [Anaerolineales bacterium]|jgi:GntR family transcriptional regulator|nr:GntR family transcriptional regulator [Anaerolineales bacterium]
MNAFDRSKPSEIFKIDRQDKLPLYEQIERNLRDLILSNLLAHDDAIPPEWELASLYGVSRLTVRRALDELVRQDWLTRRQGVGTFVSHPTVAAISPSQLSFTKAMIEIGRYPTSRLLRSGVAPADARLAQRLALEAGAPVVKIVRLRLADGQPLLYETAYLSGQRFSGLENNPRLETGSLYECLQTDYGVVIARVDETLSAVLLDAEQAELLDAPAGSPAILSESSAFTAKGEVVEYATSVAQNKTSQFYFSFRRTDF